MEALYGRRVSLLQPCACRRRAQDSRFGGEGAGDWACTCTCTCTCVHWASTLGGGRAHLEPRAGISADLAAATDELDVGSRDRLERPVNTRQTQAVDACHQPPTRTCHAEVPCAGARLGATQRRVGGRAGRWEWGEGGSPQPRAQRPSGGILGMTPAPVQTHAPPLTAAPRARLVCLPLPHRRLQ